MYKIFYLDNDPIESESFVDAMQQYFEVDYIDNIKDAIKILKYKDNEYGLYIIDLIMPVEHDLPAKDEFHSGHEFINYIRNVLYIRKPIIVLTVATREDILEPLNKLNIQEILTKPFEPSELIKRIKAYI